MSERPIESGRELRRLRPGSVALISAIVGAAGAASIQASPPPKLREVEREARRRGLPVGARRVMPPGVGRGPGHPIRNGDAESPRGTAARETRERRAAKRLRDAGR
jgi:hypothetical protein